MLAFESTCEVWVKPLFKKSRPKVCKVAWQANDYAEFLRLLQEHYEGKRWTLLSWREIGDEPPCERS